MQKRKLIQSALCAVLAASGVLAAQAQQTFKLTIASSHPPAIPWVGLMSTVFVPEVNKRVAELNKGYKIEWREAYGGQLYKANATLTSVERTPKTTSESRYWSWSRNTWVIRRS